MDSGVTMIPTQATLVQYDEPGIVREVDNTPTEVETKVLDARIDAEINEMMALRLSPDCPDPDKYETYSLDAILNMLIPSVEWIEDGKMLRQTVSSDCVDRDDIFNLGSTLNEKLKERRSSAVGICPIRRQLYSQFFDELIRQTAILCPERGLLLIRIRDELGLTLESYASIYESCKFFESKYVKAQSRQKTPEEEGGSVIFGEEPNELEFKVVEIESEKGLLLQRIRNLEDGIGLKELKYQELLNAAESLFQEEVAHLTKVKAQLEKQLELFKGPNPHEEVGTESILDKFLNKQRDKDDKKKSVEKA